MFKLIMKVLLMNHKRMKLSFQLMCHQSSNNGLVQVSIRTFQIQQKIQNEFNDQNCMP